MEKMISYCGLDCSKCGAYLATLNNDDELRKKTAEEWSKIFGADIDYKVVYCSGCTSKEGKLFQHCAVCEVRKCAMEKEFTNCAGCDEYSCEKLNTIHKMAPEAKAALDELRN